MAYTPGDYLVCQNFEGTGADNGETWSFDFMGTPTTGVVDPDYSAAPLEGSQSLRIVDDANYGGYAVHKWDGDGSGLTEIWVHFQLMLKNLPAHACELFDLYYVEGPTSAPTLVEVHEEFWVSPAGELAFWTTDDLIVTAGSALSLDQKYYVWYYNNRSSPYQSTGWVKIGTTPTIPGTNYMSWTNTGDISSGTVSYNNTVGFTTLNSEGYEFLIDRVIVNDAAIGSVDTVVTGTGAAAVADPTLAAAGHLEYLGTGSVGADLAALAASGTASGRSAALSGTVTNDVTEDDVVAGSLTAVLDLTGETWIPA
jgi:hypothetical protein